MRCAGASWAICGWKGIRFIRCEHLSGPVDKARQAYALRYMTRAGYKKPKEIMRGLMLLLSASMAFAQVDVLTQHNDNQRSGLDLHETSLTHQTVRTKFGKLWTLYSDAKIMAQPLYVSNLKSAKCPDGCNTVIFASMKGTIYAYMADQKPVTVNDTLVWA